MVKTVFVLYREKQIFFIFSSDFAFKQAKEHRIKDDRMDILHILSSSQSSITALKNVLADGRLASSPPLPPTTHPLLHPPTTPIPYPYTYWGGLWVSQRVWGGKGSRDRQSPAS